MTRGLRFVFAAALVAGATTAHADLIISEVVDGTLPGGLPKWVELTNTGASPVDLTQYSFGNFNNGGTTLGGGAASVLTGTLESCESYVISYDSSPSQTFVDVYGFSPDFEMGGAFVNGDDALVLFLGAATGDGSDATIVDIYGVIGVDGTGETWEVTDGYSYRLSNVVNGNTTWTASEWFLGGVNSLEDPGGDDAVETQNLLDLTTPGTHECESPVPTENVSWGTVKSNFR